MGRWSQRRRAGGGFSINFMTLAVITDTQQAEATWLLGINAASVDETMFDTLPSNFNASFVSQGEANSLIIDFGDDITGETSLRFNGAVPGLLNQQTINF